MTFRTVLYASVALLASVPAFSAGQSTSWSSFVTLQAPDAGTVGEPVQVTCSATDPDGISRITLRAIDVENVSTVLGVAFGADSVSATWTPAKAGQYVIWCRANGQSSAAAEELATREILVAKAESGSGSSGTPGDATPPPPPGPVAAPELGASVYQDDLAAALRAPRRVVSSADGDLFVADADRTLHKLNRRGEFVASTLQDVVSVAAGTDVVWAARRDGAVVGFEPRTGRVVRRFELGLGGGPVGLAWDEARGALWLAFASGAVETRTADGELIRRITDIPAGPLLRVADVALAPTGLVWVALDRRQPTGFLHAFNAETGEYVRSVGIGAAGEVRIPGGLAAAWDRIFVTDAFSGQVQVIDASGATVEVYGSYGDTAGKLVQPAGAAVMANGDLVVANMGAGRLDRFGVGTPLPECAGDSDCDYMSDAWELANGFDPYDPRNSFLDEDGDGLNTVEEYFAGANPRAVDTDGDGFSDADEVATGFDPRDPDSHVPTMLVDVPSLADPGLVTMTGTVKDRGFGPCAVTWRQLAGPVVELVPGAVSQSFISRRGVYKFEAVATCGALSSKPATIDVAIKNLPPRAVATRVVAVAPGQRAALSASRSSDVNGEGLRFWWDQVLGPPVTDGKPGASLGVAFPVEGLYAFNVGVMDESGRRGDAEVPVVVVGDQGVPTAVVPAAVLARAGVPVTIDAASSYRSPAATFLWSQTAGAQVELDLTAPEAPTFVPPAAGRYAFSVAIVDGALRSPPATVVVHAAPADAELPVAFAAAPQQVEVWTPVTLDAAGSSVSGSGATYRWTQVAGPAAGLTRTDRAAAVFVAFEPGSYEFELVVGDGASQSVPARVRVEARSAGLPIPVAVATGPGAAVVGQEVVLSGAESVGAVAWRWTQVEGPWVPLAGVVTAPLAAGDWKLGSSLASPTGPLTTFTPVAPGVYGFELEVDDGAVASAPARVQVVVFPNGTEN